MHHPTDRITHTTAFVTPVVEHWLEQEIAQWVHTPMRATPKSREINFPPILFDQPTKMIYILTKTRDGILIILLAKNNDK